MVKKTYKLSNYFYDNRCGGLNFYSLILVLLGLGLAIFVFLPEYTKMQNGIYNVSCTDIRSKIDSAVADYNVRNSLNYSKPGLIVDLDTLKEKGYLREIKYCPQKGQFIFGKDGKVICTIHSKGDQK
jgi:competence protein ComGC